VAVVGGRLIAALAPARAQAAQSLVALELIAALAPALFALPESSATTLPPPLPRAGGT
jgi:hypothetical protein